MRYITLENESMKYGPLKLIGGIAVFCFSQSSMATLLDFTDSSQVAPSSLSSISNGYSGSIDGIGFTLTSDDGKVNFDEVYKGSEAGCQNKGGVLKCQKDGAGIDNDEITGKGVGDQTLTLAFDSLVNVSGFYFLDLYVRPDGSGRKEQATITLDGVFFDTVDATGLKGDGGYAYLATAPTQVQTIEFTAAFGEVFWDDGDNDYALAGVEVSAVPLPPTIWLFGAGMAGLAGIRRRAKK